MARSLADFAKKNGVKYFMISYTDLFGGQRAQLVPAQAIEIMQKDGAGFAGFATWLDLDSGGNGPVRGAEAMVKSIVLVDLHNVSHFSVYLSR